MKLTLAAIAAAAYSIIGLVRHWHFGRGRRWVYYNGRDLARRR